MTGIAWSPQGNPAVPSLGVKADAGQPGWFVLEALPGGHFVDLFGTLRFRAETAEKARIRVETGLAKGNVLGTTHGGFLLAFVDQVLFVGPAFLGIPNALGGVTVDCSAQFLRPGSIDLPLDAVVEVLRETGRMIFMRGLLEQNGQTLLAFSGTIRKATPPKAPLGS